MKKYNICVKKVYVKDGAEKAFWPRVGTLTYFPAGQYEEGYKLELNMFPDTQFSVFEEKPKEIAKPAELTPEEIASVGADLGAQNGINAGDLPF